MADQYQILYIDSPSFDGREDLARKMEKELHAKVTTVSSVEEFSDKLRAASYNLYVCSDSMLFKGSIVQGWSVLQKFLAKQRQEDHDKFVVLSSRDAVIEDATLYQYSAFHKSRDFQTFTAFAKVFLENQTK